MVTIKYPKKNMLLCFSVFIRMYVVIGSGILVQKIVLVFNSFSFSKHLTNSTEEKLLRERWSLV